MAYPDEQPDPAKRAERWLERSRRDYESLERLMTPPYDPALAVYVLEQCVEKMVKAMLAAHGYSHGALTGFGHNSLKADLDYLQTLTDQWEPVRDMYPEDVQAFLRESSDALKKVREEFETPSYEHHWRAYSYDDIMDICRGLVKWKEAITSEATVDIIKESMDGIDMEALAEVLQDYDLEPADVLRLESRESPEWRTSAREGLYALWTFLALAPLAAITYPHAVSARYPSAPDAPTDPIKAALQGKLGADLYRAPLGIVEGLEEVVRLTGLVLEGLSPTPTRTLPPADLTGEDKEQLRQFFNSVRALLPPTV